MHLKPVGFNPSLPSGYGSPPSPGYGLPISPKPFVYGEHQQPIRRFQSKPQITAAPVPPTVESSRTSSEDYYEPRMILPHKNRLHEQSGAIFRRLRKERGDYMPMSTSTTATKGPKFSPKKWLTQLVRGMRRQKNKAGEEDWGVDEVSEIWKPTDELRSL